MSRKGSKKWRCATCGQQVDPSQGFTVSWLDTPNSLGSTERKVWHAVCPPKEVEA